MTVIRPNSVSGINSITAQANEIKIFKSDGTQGGLVIGGANLNATSGISTVAALTVTGNVSVGGTLTYQDVTNIDSVGVITARNGIDVTGGNVDIGGATHSRNLSVHDATNGVILIEGASNGTSNLMFADENDEDVGMLGYNHASNYLAFTVNAAERLRITSNGEIRQQSSGGSTIYELKRTDSNTTGSVGTINFTASDGHSVASMGAMGDGNNEGAHLVFRTTSAAASNSPYNAATPERLRIASDGDIEYKYDDADTDAEIGASQIPHGLRIYNTNNTLGRLAGIHFSHGSAGTANAGIFHETTNTSSGSTTCLGDLVFYTKNSGVSNMTEKLRITSDGKIGVGVAAPAQMMEITNTSSTGCQIQFRDTSTGNASSDGLRVGYNGSGGQMWNFESTYIRFATSNVERVRINSSGLFGIGTANPTNRLHVYSSSDTGEIRLGGGNGSGNHRLFFQAHPSNAYIDSYGNNSHNPLTINANPLTFNTSGGGAVTFGTTTDNPGDGNTTTGSAIRSNGKYFFSCAADGGHINRNNAGYVLHSRYNGAHKGGVYVHANATSFQTSSDYRLKENVVDLSGAITRIKELAPRRFNFINEPGTTVDGFIAHEAATVVPEAVTGTHNEVDGDGNPVYQGIDSGKLVPLLTAALQEAIAKIETLEAAVTALQGS